MKAVLISIQPKGCEKIVGGEKTIKVCKTKPSIPTPFKVYIYCTKGKPFIQKIRFGDIAISHTQISKNLYNGKVIGEFICDKVTPLVPLGLRGFEVLDETLKAMCLTTDDLNVYGGLKTLYGWHISQLKIYDIPKTLGEFYKVGAKSLEELEDELCSYCYETDYGKQSEVVTPNGYWACEGCFCEKAYTEYLEQNFALTRPPRDWMYVRELEE